MKILYSLLLVSLLFCAGCEGGGNASAYHKYHISADITWTVDETRVPVGAQIFEETGSGNVEIDALFEPGNPVAVKQIGYSHLKSYDYPVSGCSVTIPPEDMDGSDKYTASFYNLSFDGEMFNMSSLDFSYPESITITMTCPDGRSQSTPDSALYKQRFLGMLGGKTAGQFAIQLEGGVTEDSFKNVPYGLYYKADVTFVITDLGEYSEDEIKVMGEL